VATSEPRSRPRTSTRDPEELRVRLERWIALQLPASAAPRILELRAPASSGMSSETLLFELERRDAGEPQREPLVARLAPPADAVPVFRHYDLALQSQLMRRVAERSRVPVPRVRWSESDAAFLGTPFFVMDRVEGVVPPDLLPYNFGDSWVSRAKPEERARLERSTLAVLAELHAIPDAPATFPFLAAQGSALRAHVQDQRSYMEWTLGAERSPLLERVFAWLEAHWPRSESPSVLSWGDSRIGNVIYRDFEPVAVLDWEMAALGPPELDLGWLIYMHRFFEDLAAAARLPGLPDLLERERVARSYEQLSGHRPRDLDWYTLYAALRYAIIGARIQLRQVHFGEAQRPADPDALIPNRPALEAMLAGCYWDPLRR
jgi:aminoglycoside phosphotransferase (APT) family kinase protein